MNHLPADGFFMSPDPVIPPFEQAYILNKKLIDKANTLSDPVITVGGQAIQYWVAYYRELYRDALPEFFRISMQETNIRVQVEHNISLHLIAVFEAEPESYYVPQAFWTKELPIKVAALKNNVARIGRDKQCRAEQQRQKVMRGNKK